MHLFGNVAPVREIEALGVPVLEDAAQAAGSLARARPPGALGTVATFSFFPSKNLGCFGDGGMITTSDAELAERVRVLRFHGSHDKVTYEQVGYNSRLDELQAAILRVQLPHLEDWARRTPARPERTTSEAGLGELVGLPRPVGGQPRRRGTCTSSATPRSSAENALDAAEHRPRGYYRTPVHRQAAMRAVGQRRASCPATEQAAAHPPGDPDEPGAQPRAGRRGRRGRASRG